MKNTRRQVFPTGLWVLGTPIGNLGDLTQRVRWALEDADGILCEDTRVGARLLEALGISKKAKLYRLDAHATERDFEKFLEDLKSGKSLALISDAGTPSISDPGCALIDKALNAGIRVVPVPGPSALTALVSICGFSFERIRFNGFFPRAPKECQTLLGSRIAKTDEITLDIWFESPHRLLKTLEILAIEVPSLDLVIGKELTKIYECLYRGKVSEIATSLQKEYRSRDILGEWCFGILFKPTQKNGEEEKTKWFSDLELLHAAGVTVKTAVSLLCARYGVPKKEIYVKALALFKSSQE